MQPLFEITHASKSYGDVPALVDGHLALMPGQVQALVGENGAGKSTLIKIMAGVVAADSADMDVQGIPVDIRTPDDALREGMRFIHQELSFVPELSAAENIFLGQAYPLVAGLLVDWRKLYQRAREVLSAIGIDHIDPRKKMARLGTGDQMLVRIAAAFADDDALVHGERRQPKVYVMDEPTAALTGAEVELLFGVIRRLRELGDAVLYVTHRLDEVFEITDVTTVMRNGEVVASQPTDSLTHDDVIRLMTGRDLENMYPPRETPLFPEPLLELFDVSSEALREINFALFTGEILGVTGLRDGGQSELLRAIVGVKPAAGVVSLRGQPLPSGTAARWHDGLAYVPSERRSEGLVMGRSVRDNMVLPHLRELAYGDVFVNLGAEQRLSRTFAEGTRLRSTGTEQTVRQLSGGNQQKVVFARALAGQPQVLLLDEPTRGVDVGAKFDIYSLIREASTAGTGVLMASTDLPELIGMCDRVIVMRDGAIHTIVDTYDLTERDLLNLCYGNKMKLS